MSPSLSLLSSLSSIMARDRLRFLVLDVDASASAGASGGVSGRDSWEAPALVLLLYELWVSFSLPLVRLTGLFAAFLAAFFADSDCRVRFISSQKLMASALTSFAGVYTVSCMPPIFASETSIPRSENKARR